MKLWEYAILYHPRATKADTDEGRKPRSLMLRNVTTQLADSQQEVLLLAARNIPAEYTDRIDQVEIAVRPF